MQPLTTWWRGPIRRAAAGGVIAGLALLMASCAGNRAPSAAVRETIDAAWLAGTWSGLATEVGGAKTTGQSAVTVVFAPDGTWKAGTGASGTSRIEGDKVILEGGYPDDSRLRHTLKARERGGRHELWGMAEAAFGRASVSLERLP